MAPLLSLGLAFLPLARGLAAEDLWAAGSSQLPHLPKPALGKDSSYIKVTLTDAVKKGAMCLDGSPPAYWIRPGTGSGVNKWLVYHEGGGWCNSLDDCLARSKTTLGSSLVEDTTPEYCNVAFWSEDPKVNPIMHNWNSVFLHYCDGASFAGSNSEAVEVNGTKLYFRGKNNLDALQEDLLARGLKSATEVIITGGSAGGLSTFLHVDQWAAVLKERCDSPPKVRGMPDGGFFLDYEGPPKYRSQMQWVYQQQNCSAGVHSSCLEHYKQAGEDWKCIFAQYTAPFIQTPIFPLQSQYDQWQADNVLGSRADDDVNAFGRSLQEQIHATVMSVPRNGMFLDSCFHHCGDYWSTMTAQGATQGMAFQEWYNGDASKLPNKGFFVQGQAYPCFALLLAVPALAKDGGCQCICPKAAAAASPTAAKTKKEVHPHVAGAPATAKTAFLQDDTTLAPPQGLPVEPLHPTLKPMPSIAAKDLPAAPKPPAPTVPPRTPTLPTTTTTLAKSYIKKRVDEEVGRLAPHLLKGSPAPAAAAVAAGAFAAASPAAAPPATKKKALFKLAASPAPAAAPLAGKKAHAYLLQQLVQRKLDNCKCDC